MDRRALLIATGAGAAAQLCLVIVGHFFVFVADNLFALGGAAISLGAGALYARRAADADPRRGATAVGAASALVAIVVSASLGDVPWLMLLIGAVAGGLAGLAGGAVARGSADGGEPRHGQKPNGSKG